METPDLSRLWKMLNYMFDLYVDLYDFSPSERDIVLDLIENSPDQSLEPVERYPVARQGFITDLPVVKRGEGLGLEEYLYVFLDMWQSFLNDAGVFRWQVIRPYEKWIGVVFATQAKSDPLPELEDDQIIWPDIYKTVFESGFRWNRPDEALLVTDQEKIIIIKRNVHWLWTRSQARFDAESAFVQAIVLQEKEKEAKRDQQ